MKRSVMFVLSVLALVLAVGSVIVSEAEENYPIALKFQVESSDPLVIPDFFPVNLDQEAFESAFYSAVTNSSSTTYKCSQVTVDGELVDCGGPAFNCECVDVVASDAVSALGVINDFGLK